MNVGNFHDDQTHKRKQVDMLKCNKQNVTQFQVLHKVSI